jgi:hypothetical protein
MENGNILIGKSNWLIKNFNLQFSEPCSQSAPIRQHKTGLDVVIQVWT